MEKTGKMEMRCTYCDNRAIEDTYPPVCEDHIDFDKHAGVSSTLKEVERTDNIWRRSDEL